MSMKPYAFGIDVGGTTVKCGLFATDGTMLESWEIPTRKENKGESILPDIADAILGKLDEKNLDLSQVEGVGIGVPGPILPGGIVNGCVNLGWGVVDVEGTLSGLLDHIPVIAGNDANVAALGEQWKGGGKGFDNVVMVTLGTGVGGGIILNGRILGGAHGAGGEIGHMTMNKEETDTCGCGKKGCLEQYASATGIVRMCRHKLEKETRPTKLRDFEDITCKDIFDVAREGDEVARELVDVLGEMLGTALSYIAEVVDPQVFVFGGGVSRAGDILLDAVRKYYVPYAFHACRSIEFRLATLGNDAGMCGAVRMILTRQ